MIIQGSDINAEALSEIKNFEDLKKLKIFSHLPNEEEANEELWKAIHPADTEPEQNEMPDDGND